MVTEMLLICEGLIPATRVRIYMALGLQPVHPCCEAASAVQLMLCCLQKL